MSATTTYHFSSEPLIQSCPLPKSMVAHKSKSNNSLTVTAESIEPLSSFLKRHKKHLEYQVIENLIESIGRQLQLLERENMGIASFNIDDITVFHTTHTPQHATKTSSSHDTIHFAITNDDKIHEINEDHELVIDTPYSKEYITTPTNITKNKAFHSPEFKEFIAKKTIPYSIHFKSGYYSFGLLCLYCYVSRTINPHPQSSSNDDHDHDHDLETILAPIVNTKIYWFLKQVLQENPTERRYICV
jgi:hypothetical protein